MPLTPIKTWHRYEHGGRQFRILIEPRERWESTIFFVVKIDEVVSAEEVRMVRLFGELSGVDEGTALEAAHEVIARHVAS